MKKFSFKLFILTFIFATFFVLSVNKAWAGSATLTWNANSESDLNGYKIYYGTSPRTGSDPKVCTLCGYTSVVNNVSKNLTTYTFSNLTDGATYYFSVSAFDTSNNESSFSGEVVKAIPAASDITPPARSAGSPTGTLAADTTQITLSLSTNENATCRYSTTAGVAYSSMSNTFSTTGATSHSVAISGLTNGSTYNYRVRCQDSANNPNPDDYVITFSVAAAGSAGGGGSAGGVTDMTAPSKPSNFTASTTANSIILSWTNPTSDFAKVILLKSTSIISSSLTVADARSNGLIIYESNGTSFNDGSVTSGKTYYYGILSADNVPNYSAWSFLQANISAPAITTTATSTGDNSNGNTDTSGSTGAVSQYASLKNLAGVSSAIVEGASQEEAQTVYNYNKLVPLNETGKKLYVGISQIGQNLNLQAKYAIAYFIHFGTPTTMRLGAGERAGAIKSYQSAYGKLPKTTAEWKDVIKIGNGRLPSEKSQTAENKAKETFKKIYLRSMAATNTYDTNAVNIMAYGLRPVNRDINSEAFAIKTFKAIYGIMPTSASQWDIVRAISNSGAKR